MFLPAGVRMTASWRSTHVPGPVINPQPRRTLRHDERGGQGDRRQDQPRGRGDGEPVRRRRAGRAALTVCLAGGRARRQAGRAVPGSHAPDVLTHRAAPPPGSARGHAASRRPPAVYPAARAARWGNAPAAGGTRPIRRHGHRYRPPIARLHQHPEPTTETKVPGHAGPGRSGTRSPAGGRPKPRYARRLPQTVPAPEPRRTAATCSRNCCSCLIRPRLPDRAGSPVRVRHLPPQEFCRAACSARPKVLCAGTLVRGACSRDAVD